MRGGASGVPCIWALVERLSRQAPALGLGYHRRWSANSQIFFTGSWRSSLRRLSPRRWRRRGGQQRGRCGCGGSAQQLLAPNLS